MRLFQASVETIPKVLTFQPIMGECEGERQATSPVEKTTRIILKAVQTIGREMIALPIITSARSNPLKVKAKISCACELHGRTCTRRGNGGRLR